MASTNFSVRMDSEIKKQCEAMYGELGMNLTTAINVFCGSPFGSAVFPLRSGWISQTKKPLPQCWRLKGLRKIPMSDTTPTLKKPFRSSNDES